MTTNDPARRSIDRDRHTVRAGTLRRASGSTLTLAGLCVLLSGIAGCGGKKEQARAFEPIEPSAAMRTPGAWNPGSRPITQEIGRVRPRDTGEPPQLVASTRFDPPSRAAAAATGVDIAAVPPGELIPVRYAASGAAVVDVLRVLIQDFLDEDFVIDSAFTGNQPITLSIDRAMTRSEVRDMIASIALMSGARLERRDGLLVLRGESGGGAARGGATTQVGAVARNPDTPLLQAQTAFGGSMPIIRVHTFRHVQPDTLSNLLQAFLTPGATVATAGSTMVLADSADNIDRVMGLIDRLDVPAFSGVEVWTYRLRHRTPESAKTTLDAIATGSGITGDPEAAVSFVAVPGSDLLMAVAREPSVKEVVTDLIHQVDRVRESMAKQRYLYRVQHVPTQPLSTLIADFHADRVVLGTQQPRTAPGEQNRLPETDLARLVANESQNIILIEATPDDYADILATLRMVDRPPQQVFLRSVIAEVNLNDALRYGVEYFLNTLDIEGFGLLELAGSAPIGGTTPPSGSAFFVGGDGLAVVQALQTEAEVAILSQPTLTIANNATAEFQVGGSVPVVAADVDAATQVGGDTAIRRSIEYRPTGLILLITPRINESGEVTLIIEQEINEVGNQTDLGPEFTTRELNTTVTVPHGRTVVLGGIIRTVQRDSRTKIPIVGEMPVIGQLFQSRDLISERTELFITITPMIINTPNDAALVTSPFLDATHAVRRFLLEQRDDLPEGSLADPRYMADAADDGQPRLMQVPAPAAEEPEPAAAPAAEQSEKAATPDMPPIMRALMESATPRDTTPTDPKPNG